MDRLKSMALTNKQQRFIEEYLVDLNATQAAIRAGYSAKTAGVIGYENLKSRRLLPKHARSSLSAPPSAPSA